jgi:hypothetical protein
MKSWERERQAGISVGEALRPELVLSWNAEKTNGR